MKCKKCGNEIKEKANFCEVCGEKIEMITEEETKSQAVQLNVEPAEAMNGSTKGRSGSSKKRKTVWRVLLVLFIFGLIINIKEKNSNEYKLYEIWCKSIKSQWVVEDIEDFNRIEINKEIDDGRVEYNATIKITAQNIMEEKTYTQVYCYGQENKEGKIVKKLSGCFLYNEDD